MQDEKNKLKKGKCSYTGKNSFTIVKKHIKPVVTSINIREKNNVGTKDLKIVLLKWDFIQFSSFFQLNILSKPDCKNKTRKKIYIHNNENVKKDVLNIMSMTFLLILVNI